MPRAATRGLTLLELVIAIAVLVVLGTLAVPVMGARLEHEHLLRAAQSLAGDIAEARFLAARRGRAVHLQGEAGTQWCWAVADSADCVCATQASCQIHRAGVAEHPGVRLAQPPVLRLDPSGSAELRTAATLESRRGERLRVDTSRQGRPRICAEAGYWPRLPACQ